MLLSNTQMFPEEIFCGHGLNYCELGNLSVYIEESITTEISSVFLVS